MNTKFLLMTVAIFTIIFSSVAQEKGTFTDSRDGKVYKTVKIGTQTWMAENLAYKADSGCWAYKDDIANVAKYGYLYNWKAAKLSCPAGWHLPSKNEYEVLLANFGGTGKASYTALIDGGSSGFSALLGGIRYESDFFSSEGDAAHFWSTTDYSTYNNAPYHLWYLKLVRYFQSTELDFLPLKTGFSVRCIKD